MLMFISLLLSAREVSSLQGGNMSTARLGRTKLLEDLRAHSAFTHKVSPGGNDNMVHIDFQFFHYEIVGSSSLRQMHSDIEGSRQLVDSYDMLIEEAVLMVEEMIQTVTSVGFIVMSWFDPDLAWNQTDYEGIHQVSIAFDEIWCPTLLVSNAADRDYVMIERSDTMSVTSDGLIRYSTPAHLKTSCDIDVTYYPFDTQTCHIVFVPYIYDTDYSISATSLNSYEEIILTGEWVVENRSMEVTPVTAVHGMSIVKFTMTLRRRILYYVLCVLLPMLLTGVVSSMVFLLPPNSGEKISFLVTVFVTEAVFLNFIAGEMPRNMSGIPRLPLFLVIINVQCTLAMVATVFVIRTYDSEQRNIMKQQQEWQTQQHHDKISVSQSSMDQGTEQQEWQTQQHHDTISVSQSSMDQGTEQQEETTLAPSLKNRLGNYLVQKLPFTKTRPGPVAKPNRKKDNRKPQTRRRYCLPASTWNTIFFWAFNAASAMSYFLLFLS